MLVEVRRVGRGRERRLGCQLEPAVGRYESLAEGDRADVAFAYGAQ